MSTVISRRVASTPARTAQETWERIAALLAPDPKSDARKELDKAAGVACSSIASEAPKEAAFVVWGGGLRVRVYCAFDEDAMTGDDVNEDALPRSATEGAWKMSMPCPSEDVTWSQGKLKSLSTRISARSFDDDVPDDEADSESSARSMTINTEEFLKP